MSAQRTVHTVDHIIRWDYALLAVAGLYVALKVFGSLSGRPGEGSDGDPLSGEIGDAVEVIVE